MSSQSTPRKRGRPPLTKNYENPLESPMAHSSIAVQKLGGPNFIKPMMKVDMVTPKKRKQQSGSPPPSASSFTETTHTHHENDHNSSLLTHSGRYRGIILNTPLKNSSATSTTNNSNNANTSLTPDSSSQMSTPHLSHITNSTHNHNSGTEPRSNTNSQQSSIFSSAKKPSHSPVKNDYMDSYLQTSTQFTPSTSKNKFSLSLNINSNGKASIGPVLFKDDNNNVPTQQGHSNPTKPNNHVLDLLKQMKYNKLKENTKNKSNEETAIEPPPTSASSSNNDNHVFKVPKTPKSSNNNNNNNNYSPGNNHTLRTGFTPLFTLDKLLSPSRDISAANATNASKIEQTYNTLPQLSLPSGVTEKNNKNMLLNNKLAFKTAKNDNGDPILMNDDSSSLHINSMNSSFTSPKVMIPTFNTPPSFMNLGSPNGLFFSPFNKRRNPSILMLETSNGLMDNILKGNDNNNNNIEHEHNHENNSDRENERKMMEPPKTPKFNDEMLMRNNVPWSPYIQNLLDNNNNNNKINSQTNKYIHDIFSPSQRQQNTNDDLDPLTNIAHKSENNDLSNNNSDDARLALRNLINEG